jgi:large subunit ribosomal protein L10
MSRRIKELLAKRLESRYAGVQGGVIVELSGLDANDTHVLRGQLKEQNIELHVLRNRLAKRAFTGHALEPLNPYLIGPCALATGPSAVDIARKITELARKYPAIKLKMGLVEGDRECRAADMIAKLKPLSELRGELAACFLSPGRRIARCLTTPGGLIAGCIKAMIGEQQEAAA